MFPGKNPFVASARHGERANEWLSPRGRDENPLWVKPLTYPVFLVATEEWLGVPLRPPFGEQEKTGIDGWRAAGT